MKRIVQLIVCLVLMNSMSVAYAAEVDISSPTVESINISPKVAEVADVISIKAKISDVSGVSRSIIEFETPSKSIRTISLYYNEASGLWEGSYEVQPGAENGIWKVNFLYVIDKIGNSSMLYPDEHFTVKNTGMVDIEMPSLSSISISPKEAVTGDTIIIKAKLEDVSGVSRSIIEFETPSKSTRTIPLYYNEASGLWEGSYEVQPGAENGIWKVNFLYVIDKIGNSGMLYPDEQFTVKNTGMVDIEVPSLSSISISPKEAVTGDTVIIKAKLEDVSGVSRSIIEFETPSKSTRTIPLYYNEASGLWEGSYEVQPGAENGIWKVKYLYVIDKIGNSGMVYTDASFRLSFDAVPPITPTVNTVTDKSSSVTGTGEADSIISVKDGLKEIGTGTADASGHFTVNIPVQKAGTVLTVTATDASGNVSEIKEVTVEATVSSPPIGPPPPTGNEGTVDTTAPTSPTVSIIDNQSTTVNGNAEAGSTVIVKAGTVEIGRTTADSSGKYIVTIPSQDSGTLLVITATDSSGNISLSKEVRVIVHLPEAILWSVSDVTDNTKHIIGEAESGTTIEVKAGNKVIGTVTADEKNTFTVNLSEKLKAGTKITITNFKNGSIRIQYEIIVKDGTPPDSPNVQPVSDNSVTIKGAAEIDSTVYAYAGNKKIGESKAINGAFTLKIAKQKAGTVITIYAVDAASNKSKAITIKVQDKTAPSKPVVNPIYDSSKTLSGKAETGARVYAYVGKKKIGESKATKGLYTLMIAKQKAGVTVAVYAKDSAGNKSATKSIKVQDKTPPTTPIVKKITYKTVKVIGKSESKSTVYIYNGNKKIGQGTADSKGNYKVKIKAQKRGSSLKIYAQDKAGNKSKSKTVKIN